MGVAAAAALPAAAAATKPLLLSYEFARAPELRKAG